VLSDGFFLNQGSIIGLPCLSFIILGTKARRNTMYFTQVALKNKATCLVVGTPTAEVQAATEDAPDLTRDDHVAK